MGICPTVDEAWSQVEHRAELVLLRAFPPVMEWSSHFYSLGQLPLHYLEMAGEESLNEMRATRAKRVPRERP